MDDSYDFPKYADGDVSLVVSATRSYQLHSSVLKRNSTYFAQELSDPPPRLNPKARQEHLAAYRFELHGAGPDSVGRFVRKRVTESGRVLDSSFNSHHFEDSNVSEKVAGQWEWLFRSFYGKAPEFDDENLATVLQGCMGLIDVAESIDAVDQVREFVDLALLRQDAVLWQSIAGNPIAWADLGRRVHSPTIFKEGVIHMVGTWNLIPREDKDNLDKDLLRLCERKAQELDVAKEAIEMRILGHYPAFLCRLASDKPGRPSYANDIYMWMSICFFRQWFAQAISDNRTRKAEDGGFAFYNALASAGQQYLHHTDFQNFHQYFPMSSKACNVLEANMSVLKEDVKQFVTDLVQVRVHLKAENTINWLTCAVVSKEDYTWHVPEVGQDTNGLDDSLLSGDRDEDSPEPDFDIADIPIRNAQKGDKGNKGKASNDLQFLDDDDEEDYEDED